MVGKVTTIAYVNASVRVDSLAAINHVTCFTGCLPMSPSVSDAKVTGDSRASYSSQIGSVGIFFELWAEQLTGRAAPKCLLKMLRGLGTPNTFPVTENLTPVGSVTDNACE